MGKGKKLLFAVTFTCLFGTSLAIPFLISKGHVDAASPPPYSDCYGFNASGYPNTWEALYFQGYHSGIKYYWNSMDSSTRWSLAAKAWPGEAYLNSPIWTPNTYLSGNAMFVFFGHSDEHWLEFCESNGQISYLVDYRPNAPGDPQIWIQDGWCDVDDCLFVGLIGCKTCMGNDAYSSIGSYWRCVKKSDVVLGFDDIILNGHAHCFNEEFFKYAVYKNTTCGYARQKAIHKVQTIFQNNGLGMGGIDSAEIWSIDWNPYYPNYSWIRLGTPRFGQGG